MKIAGLVVALLLLAVAGRAAEPSCLGCHEQQKTQFTGSAHAQAGMTCVDCHGGDPKVTDEKAGGRRNSGGSEIKRIGGDI